MGYFVSDYLYVMLWIWSSEEFKVAYFAFVEGHMICFSVVHVVDEMPFWTLWDRGHFSFLICTVTYYNALRQTSYPFQAAASIVL